MKLGRAFLWVFAVLLVVAAVGLGVRAMRAMHGPELQPWHTHVPVELTAQQLDASDWQGYLAQERAIFDDVRANVTQRLEPDARVPYNRYFEGSPVYPGRFGQDWNHSYVMQPAGTPKGAVVLLHGLTDSPYSLRHVARRYADRGFVAIGIRLPGHGTVPAGLSDVRWEDWSASTRLAVREARRLVPAPAPLHLVGFSNGGALAVKYALDAIEDPKLTRADRLVLFTPMIGITRFARFAGLAGLPALLPPFANAAWLSNLPEFNPFKYNSFPVNAARQAHGLTVAIQRQTARYAREGRLAELPPILTFQSVADFTVSARAIVSGLYAHLPSNGSELVLFDLNQAAKLGPLLRSPDESRLARILPPPPRRYRTTVVTNASPASLEVVARTTEAGGVDEQSRPLGVSYPAEIYSLSHVALPFPQSDALYGMQPDPSEDFGVRLGALAVRGERGALVVSLDALLRLSSNPFFPYLTERIDECLVAPGPSAAGFR